MNAREYRVTRNGNGTGMMALIISSGTPQTRGSVPVPKSDRHESACGLHARAQLAYPHARRHELQAPPVRARVLPIRRVGRRRIAGSDTLARMHAAMAWREGEKKKKRSRAT